MGAAEIAGEEAADRPGIRQVIAGGKLRQARPVIEIDEGEGGELEVADQRIRPVTCQAS
jgi:hypothetical protein